MLNYIIEAKFAKGHINYQQCELFNFFSSIFNLFTLSDSALKIHLRAAKSTSFSNFSEV